MPALVQIQLPRWDHRSSFDLRRVFESLGLQKTLATAVTQINGTATSAPPQPERAIDFDRPFHYQIVHVETGLPLFMGTVVDPR
jgi:serpin B